MRVLFLNQFLAPDPAPTGQLLADLASAIAAQGHNVTVICSRGGYATAAYSDESRLDNVNVLRIPCLPFSHSRAARLASWVSYYLGAAALGFQLRPDLVITMTTPPLLSVIGTIIQQVRGGRHFIWEMDGYPDVAIALNVFRAGSSFDRLTSVLADWARRRADGIIALGDCMRDRLVARGIPAPSIHVAENWANGTLIPYAPFPPLPWDALHVLYSGNLGLAHDIDTISEVMVRLRDDPRIRFTFAGGGVRRDALEAFCRERCLPSVQFTGYQEHARLGEHLASGHIGLVTQNPATLGCLVPSKTYALMASGRPVLFIGPDQSTIARTLARFRCGWQVDAGDVNGLVLLLQTLAENPEMVRAAGWRARVAFLDHYQSHHGITRIGEIIGFGVPAQAAVPQRSDVRWSEL